MSTYHAINVMIILEIGDGMGWAGARLADGRYGTALGHVLVSALFIAVMLLLRPLSSQKGTE